MQVRKDKDAYAVIGQELLLNNRKSLRKFVVFQNTDVIAKLTAQEGEDETSLHKTVRVRTTAKKSKQQDNPLELGNPCLIPSAVHTQLLYLIKINYS